ncbi:MAG: VOC family protein [Halieaceae bacterium]|nr:VOC family protein [Halieaceae bacterium]
MASQISGIHHINFLVRDLDAAEQRYRELLGLEPALRGELPGRGVITARFKLGESWLVLVQPTSEEGEPARLLREHGEGFMLLSLAVDDLDGALAATTAAGGQVGPERTGLEGWRVADLSSADTFGAQLQLCEAPGGS